MDNTLFDSSKNSTIVRLMNPASAVLVKRPATTRAVRRISFAQVAAWLGRRAGLRTSSLLAPDLAGLWAERLFLTPPAPRFEDQELFAFLDAHQDFVLHRGRRLVTWRWGESDAPAVLLAHGWGGRAAQLRPLVSPLLAAGYRVVTFDQPAHGLSEGRITALPDLADAIKAVAHQHGGVVAAVGHSMGGSALAFALSRDFHVGRAVLINAPSDITGFSRRFARWFSLPERVRVRMQFAIEERYGVNWAELEIPRLTQRLDVPALVIHDREDREVPMQQGEALAASWRGARLLRTTGLGHKRILEDERVGQAVADFIRGGSGFAPLARALATEPAPIY